MERVKFFDVADEFVILYNTEEVAQGAKLLRPFFWVFTGHGEPRDHANYRRDFASFYSARLPRMSELQERFKVVKVELTAKDVPSVFFDEKDHKVDLSDMPPQKVVCLFVNEQLAGVYFKRNRVLVATDWTHDDRCISVLKQLLPSLSKVFKRKSCRPPRPRVKITFGADPEFEILRNGRVVSASGIVKGGIEPNELVGRDGAGSQVEIRPVPSTNIRQFLKNFKKGLMEFAKLYPGYSLSTQGDRFPLGGHIHLSIPPSKEIVDLLDNWIGEQVIDLSGLARGPYKKMGAIEHKPWGFEYRTPPASIFLKPNVLKAVLKIIKQIINAYYSKDGVALAPDDDEIKRLGLNKEWQILNDFIARYPKLSKDILKNWRIRVLSDQYINIVCKDDWKEDVMVFVKDLLHKKLSKTLIKKLNDKNIHKIIFFGLKKERGEVCNFPNKLFSTIEYNYPTENSVAFGFPYSIRMPEVLTDEIRKKWNILVDDIMKELHYAVK